MVCVCVCVCGLEKLNRGTVETTFLQWNLDRGFAQRYIICVYTKWRGCGCVIVGLGRGKGSEDAKNSGVPPEKCEFVLDVGRSARFIYAAVYK